MTPRDRRAAYPPADTTEENVDNSVPQQEMSEESSSIETKHQPSFSQTESPPRLSNVKMTEASTRRRRLNSDVPVIDGSIGAWRQQRNGRTENGEGNNIIDGVKFNDEGSGDVPDDGSTVTDSKDTVMPRRRADLGRLLPSEKNNHEILKYGQQQQQLMTTMQQNTTTVPIVLPLNEAGLPENSYELLTTFDGSSGSFGAMFDITANELQNSDARLRIDSLDIHTQNSESCDVLVYVLKEKVSHVGHETNPDTWSLAANTTVWCEGLYKRTHVPLEAIVTHHDDGSYDDRLTLRSGETMGFYVMMEVASVRYTNSYSFGDVFSSNDHLMIREGTGVGTLWGGEKGAYLYRPRVWNGSVRYEVIQPPSNIPHGGEVMIIPDDLCPKRISTPYVTSISSYGNMFNVRTKSRALTISGMSLCTDRLTSLSYEIYTKRGSFEESGMLDSNVWKLIASGNVTGAGTGVGTPIPSEHFLDDEDSLAFRTIPTESTQGFYVTFTTNDMNYVTSSLDIGETMLSNDDIDVLVGVGVGNHPLGQQFYNSRLWRGQIEYDLHDTCPPTVSPSLSPSSMPSLPVTPSPTLQPTTASPTWECSKEANLWTTANGETSSYGNMFEVVAPYREDQQALVIKSLDVFIQKAGEDVRVLVYSRIGSFEGHELDESAWTLVCNTTVTSSPYGDFTQIPDEDFRDIRMVGPETRSFYVTLDTSALIYTKSDNEAEVDTAFASDSFLQIFKGNGIGRYPLFGSDPNQLHRPRTWNGKIRYETQSSCANDEELDQASSTAPDSPSEPSADGVGFVSLNKPVVSRVALVFNVEYDQTMVPVTTPLADLNTNLRKTMGLLLSSDSQLQYYVAENKLEVVHVSSDVNDDTDGSYFCVPADAAKTCSNVKSIVTLTHTSILSSDAVTYELLRLRDEVLEGLGSDFYDVRYVGDLSVEAQTEIILTGVPAKLMGDDEAAFFESTAKRFLSGAVAGPGSDANGSVKILTVTIEQQDLKNEGNNEGTDKSVFEGRIRHHHDTSNNSDRSLQDSSSSISIVTTVTGQYLPPPEINFPVLVQDSIDAGENDLVNELVNPPSGSGVGAGYFKSVEGVEVIRLSPPPTPSPTASPKVETSSEKSFSVTMILIIGCSAAAVAVLALVLLICFRKRKKTKEASYTGIKNEIKIAGSDRTGFTTQESTRQSFTTNFSGPMALMQDEDEDALYIPQTSTVKFATDDGTVGGSTISTKSYHHHP